MAKLFDKITKAFKKNGIKIPVDDLFDYSDLEKREKTVQFLYNNSRDNRASREEYWKKMREYYDGDHETTAQMSAFVQSQGLPWSPSQSTDGFIHVETQIDTAIPEFEFAGRDDDLDNVKAKQRELAVRYVFDNNPMELMNNRNERRMNLYGLACWKPCFDATKKMGKYMGDIRIGNPKPQQLFFDPTVVEDIDEGEFAICVYRMHKMATQRYFAKDLKRINKTIQDFDVGYGLNDTEFMQCDSESYDSYNYNTDDQTLQIMEFYFRQPQAGKEKIEGIDFEWEAGEIGLIILINQEEVRYVPKYWVKTGCQMYPFSVYCKTPNDDSIYGKSELEMIKGYIDSTDRALSYAQLNDAFMANDVIIVEEGALADDCDVQNVPGGVVKTKTGRKNDILRLPNLSGANRPLYDAAEKFKTMMQNTNGNFDAFQGNNPTKATTATEIAILDHRAKSRQELKKSDRNYAWKRLVMLIDYLELEHFDDDRMIFIGAKNKNDPKQQLTYNSDNLRAFDESSGEFYYPVVDMRIHIGDGLKNSKAFTISAIKELALMKITPENSEFIKAYVDEIDIPLKVQMNEFIDKVVGQQNQMLAQAQMQQGQAMAQQQQEDKSVNMQELLSQLSPEELKHLEENPQLMQEVAAKNGVALK